MSDTEDNIVDIDDEPEEEPEPAESEAEDGDGEGDGDDGEVPTGPVEPSKYLEVVIDPANFRTPDVLSLYEQTELISTRGTQIADFNNPIGDYPGCKTEMEIARRELAARKCPLMVRREVGRRVVGDTTYIYVEMRDPNVMVLSVPIE